MGPGLVSPRFMYDGTRTGPILRGHGQEKECLEHVDAVFYVLGHCQRIMGSLRV